jgi:hypothetical protein
LGAGEKEKHSNQKAIDFRDVQDGARGTKKRLGNHCPSTECGDLQPWASLFDHRSLAVTARVHHLEATTKEAPK